MAKASPELQEAGRQAVMIGLMWITKPMLRKLCEDNSLKVSGTKQELANRLWEYFDTADAGVRRSPDGGIQVEFRAWKRG